MTRRYEYTGKRLASYTGQFCTELTNGPDMVLVEFADGQRRIVLKRDLIEDRSVDTAETAGNL